MFNTLYVTLYITYNNFYFILMGHIEGNYRILSVHILASHISTAEVLTRDLKTHYI